MDSIKFVLVFSFASKDNLNSTVLTGRKLFIDELGKFFENKNMNYSIATIEQTWIEEKQGTCSCLLCYDTTRKNIFRAIDWNIDYKNKITNILNKTIHNTCHYIIGDESVMNEKYILVAVNSYNEKYGVVLKKNDAFGYL